MEIAEKDRDNLKLKVQSIFTMIRNTINDREDEILSEIDNTFKNTYFNEKFIKTKEKLQKQIKLSLEKGKLIDEEKEWDYNKLNSYINDCINIEKNINIVNNNNKNINELKKIKFEFSPKEYLLELFLDYIKKFGKIYSAKYSFRECPFGMKDERKYILKGPNNNIIEKIGSDNSMGTICEKELDKSIEEHKWKIKILKTKNRNLLVGVAPVDFDIYSSEQYQTCGWYLYCSDLTVYSGPPHNYRGIRTNLNTLANEIIVIMNMKKRELKFVLEDEEFSFNNIPIDKPLYPAVLLCNKDDTVEITEC